MSYSRIAGGSMSSVGLGVIVGLGVGDGVGVAVGGAGVARAVVGLAVVGRGAGGRVFVGSGVLAGSGVSPVGVRVVPNAATTASPVMLASDSGSSVSLSTGRRRSGVGVCSTPNRIEHPASSNAIKATAAGVDFRLMGGSRCS